MKNAVGVVTLSEFYINFVSPQDRWQFYKNLGIYTLLYKAFNTLLPLNMIPVFDRVECAMQEILSLVGLAPYSHSIFDTQRQRLSVSEFERFATPSKLDQKAPFAETLNLSTNPKAPFSRIPGTRTTLDKLKVNPT